ncbi:orf 35 [Ateline gammaherpesvirus 3]|uniref:Orf 35 n=1 Tax=Ateline herpesvirus 3 TaxID=85618 RepID=Q9YTN0_ATHV3|nr:orf 35 [Ateline gammaherpesvirus 3]AAC95561.1 orf 35 [Ateline gammaherpesvirus 3]
MNSNRKKFLCSAFEAEINKKTSVSLFDRFGESNCLFLHQLDTTKKSLIKHENLKKQKSIEGMLQEVNLSIQEKKKELSLLKTFDRHKLSDTEDLQDKISELTEDLQFEIEALNHGQSSSQEEESSSENTVTGTIMRWRIEALPRVPSTTLQ